MRLSDAIALGRVTIEKWKLASLGGCALGMAANAIGIQHKYFDLGVAWPWIESKATCCPFCDRVFPSVISIKLLIGHVFDAHVIEDLSPAYRHMTLDELIDWVRSIEPAEVETMVEMTESVNAAVCR